MNRCWVEISLPRLRANLEAVGEYLGSSQLAVGSWQFPNPESAIRHQDSGLDPRPPAIIAVVKANGYGHGLVGTARCLFESGVRDFAVSWVDDAVALRQALPGGRILVLGGISPGEENVFREHRLRAVVFDDQPVGPDVQVELKIDTGMTRLGVPLQESRGWIEKFGDRLAGVFSHFGSADCDPEFTRLQTERFLEATAEAGCRRHLCNSAGLAYPEAWLDAVRVGLVLYGVPPCSRLAGLPLQPALSWKTRILAINRVPAGRSSGYGGTFTARRPSRLGILPVGYADSYSRLHSNRGQVEVCGRLAPVAGAVSMDLTTIDLTDIPQARPGDEAVLLSNHSASPLSAVSLARQMGTIPYEVLTAIPEQLKRVFVED